MDDKQDAMMREAQALIQDSRIWTPTLKSPMAHPIVVALDMDGLLTKLPDSNTWKKDPQTGIAPWEELGSTVFMNAEPQEKGILLAQALNRKTAENNGDGWIVTIITKMHRDANLALHHAYQKIDWLKKRLPGMTISFCAPSISKSERMKQLLGGKNLTPNCILIDDYPENILEWEAAGGLGFIWHPSVDTRNKFPKCNYISDKATAEEIVSMIQFYTQAYDIGT